MKVTIKTPEECAQCNACVDAVPAVFEMGEKFVTVKVQIVPKNLEKAVKAAAGDCPVSIIVVSE
jgi:ferredoxin